MRKLLIAIGVAALVLLSAGPIVQTQSFDVSLNTKNPPVCNPLGLTPNLYYDAAGGHWHCISAAAPWESAGSGTALSSRDLLKEVTGIADATATAVATVTVPNGAHAAVIPITIMSRLGAGGAVGADECVGTAYGQIVVERVAGAATVATATSLSNTGSACSSGATTITTAYAVSTITGGNSATQTFTINITVTKGAGSSANHKVDVQIETINANASGITVS